MPHCSWIKINENENVAMSLAQFSLVLFGGKKTRLPEFIFLPVNWAVGDSVSFLVKLPVI